MATVKVTLPNGSTINANLQGGKVQDNIPTGSVVHTGGGDYRVTGGSAGNYTSQKVTGGSGSGSSSSRPSSSGGSSSSNRGGSANSSSGGRYTTSGGSSGGGSGGGTNLDIQIQQAMAAGANANYVQNLVNQRYDKIASAGGALDQYKNDATMQAAWNYINQANKGTGGRGGAYVADGRVYQTAQGLGYYGNDPTLQAYYDNLANLYNTDKVGYLQTIYNRGNGGAGNSMMPNMGRDPSLAGKVVAKGNYAVYYDENGYAVKAVKMGNGTSVADLNANGYYTGAQRTWADVTGGNLYDVYGQSGAGIFSGGAQGAGAAGSGNSANLDIQIQQAMANGASADYVQQLVNARYAKIAAAGGSLDQYMNDATMQAAQNYIAQAQNNAYYQQMMDALAAQQNDGLAGQLSYEDYLASSGYNDALSTIQAANDAALQQLQNQTALQTQQANESYDDAARQAYITYMQSRRTLPQRMSASGLNGGLADSQEIALDAELQNNQTAINLERQSALQQMQAALQNSQLAQQQNYLGTLAGLQQNAMSGYQSYAQQQQALQQENYWNNQQLAQSIAQQDWENALTLMQILGYSDEQIAQVLGIAAGTQTDDAAYRAAQLELAMMGY